MKEGRKEGRKEGNMVFLMNEVRLGEDEMII